MEMEDLPNVIYAGISATSAHPNGKHLVGYPVPEPLGPWEGERVVGVYRLEGFVRITKHAQYERLPGSPAPETEVETDSDAS